MRLPAAAGVLAAMSAADLRARYGRGPWRFVKWLLDPFALVGIYLVLVGTVLNKEGRAVGLSLACAVVPFQLLMMTVLNALDSVRIRAPIIGNMSFRRTLIPITSVVTESMAFAASLLLLAIMMGAYGVAPTAALAWLPVVIAVNLLFAAAVAYPAALTGVWLRDLGPFVISFVRTMFFLAPGLVALDQIDGSAADAVKVNPLTGLFEAYRDALLYGRSPEAWKLLWPLALAAVIAVVIVPIYRREQRDLAKVI
jgi:lipopolysaccharide transport system permease protein